MSSSSRSATAQGYVPLVSPRSSDFQPSSFLPLLVRRRRQLCTLALLAAFLALSSLGLVHWVRRPILSDWQLEDAQGRCEFVSPVEAYWKDVRRMRAASGRSGTAASWTDDARMKAEGWLGRPTKRAAYDRNGLVFESNGEVYVESIARSEHPIPELLQKAERKWLGMIARQSMSLQEAVSEYEFKWRRKPPKGFDHWWRFVKKHRVMLPDEFSELQDSLVPYFAIPPAELRRRSEMVQGFAESFVLRVRNKNVSLALKDGWREKWPGTESRALAQMELMRPFVQWLPDVNATFSLHDGPSVYPDWARTRELTELASEGEVDEEADTQRDRSRVLWKKTCPPSSDFVAGRDPRKGRKSFIWSHDLAQDICSNPSIAANHGTFLEPHGPDSHPRPHSILLPILTFAKTWVNGDILAAPLDQFNGSVAPDPPWEKKTNMRLDWRGATTGILHSPETQWRSSHRSRLTRMANLATDAPHTILAPAVDLEHGFTRMKEVIEAERNVTDFYFDVKFTGHAIQCEGGACEEMTEEFPWSTTYQNQTSMNSYKFVFDTDGNSWSARFRRLLSLNALTFKSTIYPEWNSKALVPWFHYVPIKMDYTDLVDALAFFRGTPAAPGGFDEVAKAISRNGQCFVRRLWREQDLQAYMFLVHLELARLLAPDRAAMEFTLPASVPSDS